MAFTESLVVRILADSSELRRELTDVAQLLDDVQSRVAQSSEFGSDLEGGFERLAAMGRPLQALGNQIDRISHQLQALSQQPITLNVRPALSALQQLLQAAQQTAAQLQALSLAPSLNVANTIGMMGPAPVPELPPRAYATGGLVTGPGGVDQVAARLTAGEYVLNHQAVASLGTSFLDRLNQQPMGTLLPVLPDPQRQSLAPLPPPTQRPRPFGRSPLLSTEHMDRQQTTNHFGGIEIHVRESADVGEVLQDLRRQGIGLRNRRG